MDVDRLLDQARELLGRGDVARAKGVYLEILLRDRYHLDGMLGLGEVFIASREFESARVVLTQAVARHQESSLALSALGGVLLEFDELVQARNAFLSSLRIDPLQRKAWAGLGVVFERTGDVENADRAWHEAFREGAPAISIYRGDSEPTRVLLLCSAVDGNIPLEAVLDNHIFQWSTLFVESFHEGMLLPRHSVVFNAVGNADLRTRALEKAEAVLQATNAPVINHPAAVRKTGRVQVAERLRNIPGVVVPRMLARGRDEVDDPGLGWPLLVRSRGFHTGEHFVKVDEPATVRAAAAELPGDELLAIEYIDTRDADGAFCKYRVLAIDGELYPQHLAFSREWKVHYFSAAHDARSQLREQSFLEDPTGAIGEDAVTSLRHVARELELDYGGIDFAVDAGGRVVVFEANPTMVIVLPNADPDRMYRHRAAERAIQATRAMIQRRAESKRRDCI